MEMEIGKRAQRRIWLRLSVRVKNFYFIKIQRLKAQPGLNR